MPSPKEGAKRRTRLQFERSDKRSSSENAHTSHASTSKLETKNQDKLGDIDDFLLGGQDLNCKSELAESVRSLRKSQGGASRKSKKNGSHAQPQERYGAGPASTQDEAGNYTFANGVNIKEAILMEKATLTRNHYCYYYYIELVQQFMASPQYLKAVADEQKGGTISSSSNWAAKL